MGRWKYLHLPVLLLSAYYIVFHFYKDRAITNEGRHEVVKSVGPWQVALTHPREVAPGVVATVGVRFICRGCQANYKRLVFALGTGSGPTSLPILVKEPAYRLVAQVPIPAALAPDPQLWLTIEGWDGIRHHVAWPSTTSR
jgi:hypothetical protein